MSQRLTAILAFCLPLFLAHPGGGAAKSPVTTKDADGMQLEALSQTENNLAALAKLPPAGSTAKAPHKKHARRSRKKGVGATTEATLKAPGKHLTVSDVQQILAGSRDFSGADLSGLNLAGTDLSGANFSRADLTRTNLERADLSETDLEQADLTNANLTRATLHMARFLGTRIWGARFDGALWTDRTLCRSGSLGRCKE